MSLTNSENALKKYWNRRKEINHQYYIQRKELERKYFNAIKKLDDEYESTIKNWAKNIMLKYLDEQDKGFHLFRENIQKDDNLNLNANSFLDKAQQVDNANDSKNELEMETPEEEKEDSEISNEQDEFNSSEESKKCDSKNNKNKKVKK